MAFVARKQTQPSNSPKRKKKPVPVILVNKEHGGDQVSLVVLDEAFKMSKIRLQMAQTSVLYKFNDDDRRIFAQFRS